MEIQTNQTENGTEYYLDGTIGVVSRAAGRVEVQSQQPRDKLAAAIAEEGYEVAA